MKIKSALAGFLAIYLLAIVLIPCSDTCASEVYTNEAAEIESHQNQEKENDLCSPFCSCSCCSSLIVTTQNQPLVTLLQSYSRIFQSFNSFFIPGVYTDHWQPPKVGCA